MATKYDPSNNTFSHIGVPFNYTRGNPMPLDNSTIWNSLNEASAYALSSPVAYVGQMVTVVNSGLSTVTVYKINTDNTLAPIAPSISIDVDDLPLSAGTGVEITTDGYINTNLSTGLNTDDQNNIYVSFASIDGGNSAV